MRKSMLDNLKSSVKDEEKTTDSKLTDFTEKSDKFKKADAFFDDKDTTKNTKTVIRDVFSFPDNDYSIIDKMIKRALSLEISTNKSEIIRAGLNFVKISSDHDFKKMLASLEKIKKGRKKYK
jgi:hypothetical protein